MLRLLKWKRFFGRKTILRNMMFLSLFASIIPIIAVGFGSYLFSAYFHIQFDRS